MVFTILVCEVLLVMIAISLNCYAGHLEDLSTLPRAFMTLNQILAGDYDAEPLFENTSYDDPYPIALIVIAVVRLFIVMAFTNILIVVVLERYSSAKADTKNVK